MDPARQPEAVNDLVIIGGGVMGLFTAYHASERFERVVVVERGRIGDPTTASYGRTRSFRNDYLDATYAQMSHETLTRLGLRTASFGGSALRGRFPYIDADMGYLDVDAGVVDLPSVTRTLTRVLGERRV